MNYLTRVSFVFLLVFSLVVVQENALFAQTNVVTPPAAKAPTPAAVATSPELVKLAAALSTTLATPNSALPAPVPSVPQPPATPASSEAGHHLPLIAGLAMTGVGIGLLAHTEPVHQTVCITYGICPVPGATHVAGGILIGVGAPLALYKLVKH